MNSKRELIIDAMQNIMSVNETASATMSDVAKAAGIAKGSIYYYFRSKDEIIDAVIERAFARVIRESEKMLESKSMTALEMFEEIFNISVYPERKNNQDKLLQMLEAQDDITVHQKFCLYAAKQLTPILSKVIERGIEEGVMSCDYPLRYAQFILTMILITLDTTLVPASRDALHEKFVALAQILETSMKTPPNSFSYLYTPPEKK